MALELDDPEIVTMDEFTVAGLAHRGPPEDNYEAIWMDFNERVEDFAELTGTDETYGVIYQYDESGEEFTYVAGVPVDETSGLSAELTVVEIPETSYAVFEADELEVQGLLDQVTEEWGDDTEHGPVEGPIFERYGTGYDPTNRTGGYELYVPVETDEGEVAADQGDVRADERGNEY